MKCYIEPEMKWQIAFLALNKLYFNNELPSLPIISMPSSKDMDIEIENEVLIINILSENEDHVRMSYLLFELCQLSAFRSGIKDRTGIALELANIMDNCGYYVDGIGEINLETRFMKNSQEYKEIQEEILYLSKDIQDSF